MRFFGCLAFGLVATTATAVSVSAPPTGVLAGISGLVTAMPASLHRLFGRLERRQGRQSF